MCGYLCSSVVHVLLIGCGYTGKRVARRLLARGIEVTATARDPATLDDLASLGAAVLPLNVLERDTVEKLGSAVSPGTRVMISVPTIKVGDRLFDPTPRLLGALRDRPSRVVYLSTTGVYGKTTHVDEGSPAAPVTERQRLRFAAEQAVADGPWSSLILRPAAIYGPRRGVHAAMREGRYKLVGDGSNFISRIHVDDLAMHTEQALLSDLTGAYPVADERPCPSHEIAAFCAELLNLSMPVSVELEDVSETRRADRRVDGRAITRLLGVDLLYPSYREGIPAAIAEEEEAG